MKSTTTTKRCTICNNPKSLGEFTNSYVYKEFQYKKVECKPCRAEKYRKKRKAEKLKRKILKLERLSSFYGTTHLNKLKDKLKKEIGE